MASAARAEPAVRTGRGKEKSRREQIEETLKELQAKKSKRPPLQTRIGQAGLSLSKRNFLLASAAFGIAVFLAAMIGRIGLLPALALGFAGGFGVPLWLISYLKKRREARFLEVFPDAVDIIVRGIKAGLPLNDCLKIIAQDSEEPVKGEFRALVDSQTIGLPLGEACAKIYERIPLPEANFFAIVISIPQKAGGNLSEALGNLSRVLRDRKRMKAKIRAMSTEAKASAAIIAALPVAVMILVYISSPNYISLLWTHNTGHLMLAASALWMACGVLVMKKMINFDF
jgi:tight adherence protein B